MNPQNSPQRSPAAQPVLPRAADPPRTDRRPEAPVGGPAERGRRPPWPRAAPTKDQAREQRAGAGEARWARTTAWAARAARTTAGAAWMTARTTRAPACRPTAARAEKALVPGGPEPPEWRSGFSPKAWLQPHWMAAAGAPLPVRRAVAAGPESPANSPLKER